MKYSSPAGRGNALLVISLRIANQLWVETQCMGEKKFFITITTIIIIIIIIIIMVCLVFLMNYARPPI
jgi:amino acid permease